MIADVAPKISGPLYLLTLFARIPPFTPDLYFTLILRSMGFSTSESNLLTIPPCAIFIVTVSCDSVASSLPSFLASSWTMLTTVRHYKCFISALLAEKLNQRAYSMALSQVWVLVCLIALVTLPEGVNRWTTYIICKCCSGSSWGQKAVTSCSLI